MKTFLRACWCAAAVVLGSVGVTAANDWTVSHHTDGYTVYHGNSYYWKGNDAYTRQQYYRPGYYAYGYYYPPSNYYQYSYSYTYQYPQAQVSYKDTDWRQKLLAIAEGRDKAEATLRKAAAEQTYFLEAVQALGLSGNFTWQGYGTSPYPVQQQYAPGGGGYQNKYFPQSGLYGGNTQYGYSVKEVAEFYGDSNPAALYQQAARLTQNAQQLAGQATGDFSALVSQEGSNRARVAEVLAKGAAAAQVLKAADAPPSSRFTKQEFRIDGAASTASGGQAVGGEGGPPPGAAAAPNGTAWRAAWQVHAQTKCAVCHAGPDAKSKFEVMKFYDLPRTRRALLVAGRLATDDDEKRMPRTAEGHAGPRLTDAELELWMH